MSVLPGRDGLLHISKLSPLAGGKRVGAVEDVLSLGQDIEVRVDDIDPQGKVSLSLANAPEVEPADAPTGRSERPSENRLAERREPTNGRSSGPENGAAGGPAVVSFEDAFEAELVADLGDLGPGAVAGPDDSRGGGGDDRRRSRGRSRRR